MESKSKLNYKLWLPKAPESDEFPKYFNFYCIKSLGELEEVLNSYEQVTSMGFDTETTGLNHEDIFMVGYSFCMDSKNAYYVPVQHETFGLGEKAIDLIYQKMCDVPTVFMFNMRYDVRVMEWHGFKEAIEKIDNSNLSEEAKLKLKAQILNSQVISKYDMNKVNTIDVQAMIFDIDTGNKYPSLKKSEEYFLGWRGDSFEDTLGDKGNFYYLTPEEAYFYAATDALGTYLLGEKLLPIFLKQTKKSGQLDVKCLLPLARYENEMTRIDVDKLKEYSIDLSQQIQGCQERCWKTAGREFNLGSPKDNNEILTKLNIHTGVNTTRGMSTSKTAIAECLKTLSKDDPARQFLTDLVDYASLTKQRSSYVDNTIEMCNNAKNHPNRLRFSYRNTEVPSGRFAAGGDKKNQFFSQLNIQNITKPHVVMHYTIKFEDIKEQYPEVYNKILESGTLEECDVEFTYTDEQLSQLSKTVGDIKASEIINNIKGKTFKRHSYKILDWIFSDYPWLVPRSR